jgi:hypothetical protein
MRGMPTANWAHLAQSVRFIDAVVVHTGLWLCYFCRLQYVSPKYSAALVNCHLTSPLVLLSFLACWLRRHPCNIVYHRRPCVW